MRGLVCPDSKLLLLEMWDLLGERPIQSFQMESKGPECIPCGLRPYLRRRKVTWNSHVTPPRAHPSERYATPSGVVACRSDWHVPWQPELSSSWEDSNEVQNQSGSQ